MKRRLKRKLNINKKVIAVLAIFLAVGFAYITSAVNIGGVFTLFKSTWDIHFDNVQVTEGSVEASTPTFDSQHPELDLSVSLTNPGDFYEFTIDAVNNGDIDGMLDSFSDLGLTSEQLAYLKYTIIYADGEELAQYQELNAGDTCTFKIRIEFRDDIQAEDLPAGGASLNLGFDVSYVRADSNRIRRRAENTLYNVLKTEAESGGLAKKYTGAHQDSMDASKSTKDIYHWYADNDTDGTAVTNKNNVIFANHCWQLIRTTDTGGAKLIYNGEVENDQCLNTRGTHDGYGGMNTQTLNTSYYYGTSYIYDKTNNNFMLSGTITTGTIQTGQYTCKETTQNATCSTLYYVDSLSSETKYYVIQIKTGYDYSTYGELEYNYINSVADSCPANVGYMYNIKYPYKAQSTYSSEYNILSSDTANTSYWYSDSVKWGTPTANKYNLNNPYQISSTDDYPSLVGKYTFGRTGQTYVDTRVRYIVAIDNNGTYYYIELGNETGSTHDIDYYNHKYTYGDSYTDNGNGTYTINNPISINRDKWYTNYNNLMNKYVCKNTTNATCSDLWYTTLTNKTYMNYIKVSNVIKYSKDFTWDGTKYILDNNSSVSFWNNDDSTNVTKINNAHYTCMNSSGLCDTLFYIYSTSGWGGIEYIELTNGKNITDSLDEMLYNDNVNTKNSTIKTGIDLWYENHLSNYSNYLEDTIFCNNRSQINADTNGWNPNGGIAYTSIPIQFKEYNITNDLSCTKMTDKFSVTNNKAKLNYKVGLISSPEMSILNNSNIKKCNVEYWLLSPLYADGDSIRNRIIYTDGSLDEYPTNGREGVRPSISLSPTAFYTSGDGSMENPYVIYTE